MYLSRLRDGENKEAWAPVSFVGLYILARLTGHMQNIICRQDGLCYNGTVSYCWAKLHGSSHLQRD